MQGDLLDTDDESVGPTAEKQKTWSGVKTHGLLDESLHDESDESDEEENVILDTTQGNNENDGHNLNEVQNLEQDAQDWEHSQQQADNEEHEWSSASFLQNDDSFHVLFVNFMHVVHSEPCMLWHGDFSMHVQQWIPSWMCTTLKATGLLSCL